MKFRQAASYIAGVGHYFVLTWPVGSETVQGALEASEDTEIFLTSIYRAKRIPGITHKTELETILSTSLMTHRSQLKTLESSWTLLLHPMSTP